MPRRVFDNPDADPGVWFDQSRDQETGLKVRYKLRGIPAETEREVRRKLKDTRMTIERGGKTHIDLERSRYRAIIRAGIATVETENETVYLGEQTVVERYRSAINGSVRLLTINPQTSERLISKGTVSVSDPVGPDELKVGDIVILDGAWNDQLRRIFFTDNPDVAEWVIRKVDRAQEEEEQEEEDLLGN